MVAPVTPQQWLELLTRRLDERRPRMTTLRSYVDGNAPLPEMGRNLRSAWERFQREARSNYGQLVVEAAAERMICTGARVGAAQQDDDRLRAIWEANRLDVVIGDAIRDCLTYGIGYIAVGAREGEPVITSESPEFMIAATDPLQPWVSRAALKTWRDLDAEMDYAYVWAAGVRVKYERSCFVQPFNGKKPKLWPGAQGGWSEVEGSAEEYLGDPPIFVLENHASMGEFEAHIDVINRINRGVLQRLVTVAMQAFRQRAVKGNLPDVDEQGRPIDYSAIFTPAPGALWELPEGVEIWESQEAAQSIQQMLAAVKDDIRDLAADTRTPLAVLVPDAANQSAEGAAFAREGLVFKARDRINRVKPSINAMLKRALQVEVPDFDERIVTVWAPPEHVSLAERYDAAVKAKAAGVPWRTVMISILGFTPDEVDNMLVELADEQMMVQALLNPPQADAVA